MQKHMHSDSGATACTGLSAHFLINSASPTFSIFLAFILYSHLYTSCAHLVHHLVHLVHLVFLLYLLALSILLNSTLFAYILLSVFHPQPSLSNFKSFAFAPLPPLPHIIKAHFRHRRPC